MVTRITGGWQKQQMLSSLIVVSVSSCYNNAVWQTIPKLRGLRYWALSFSHSWVCEVFGMQETCVQSLGREDPLEKEMTTHSSTFAWKILLTEEPGRLQSMGSPRVGCNWATSLSLFIFMHWRRKWQPTPVFLPGEPQGRGSLVGCLPSMGLHRVGHDWSDLAAATCVKTVNDSRNNSS